MDQRTQIKFFQDWESRNLVKENSFIEKTTKATENGASKMSEVDHDTETIYERSSCPKNGAQYSRKIEFFPFGTTFQNIAKFTSNVEVFTRHIDTFTRDQLSKKLQ